MHIIVLSERREEISQVFIKKLKKQLESLSHIFSQHYFSCFYAYAPVLQRKAASHPV